MHLIKYAAPVVLSLSSVVGCALGEISIGVDTGPQQENLVTVNSDEKSIVVNSVPDVETTRNDALEIKAVEVAKYVIGKNNGVGDMNRYRTLFVDKILIDGAQYEITVADVNEREFRDSRVKDGLEIAVTKKAGPTVFLQDRGFDGNCDFGTAVTDKAAETFDYVNKFGNHHQKKYQEQYSQALDAILSAYKNSVDKK